MPMTILFFSFLALVFLYELEADISNTGYLDWMKALQFPIARKSLPTISGLVVLAVLFLFEIKLFIDGRIYTHADKYSSIIRAVLVVALCFLAVIYRALILRARASHNMSSTMRIQKCVIVLTSFVILAVFLGMQFNLIF